MLYWICPECGGECSPAIRECPACAGPPAISSGEPDRLKSSFINGIKRMPVRLTGSA